MARDPVYSPEQLDAALREVLRLAGGPVFRVVVDERPESRWDAATSAALLLSLDSVAVGLIASTPWRTLLFAQDPQLNILAQGWLHGTQSEALVCSLARWGASTGGVWELRRDVRLLERFDARYPLQCPPPERSLQEVAKHAARAGYELDARAGELALVGSRRRRLLSPARGRRAYRVLPDALVIEEHVDGKPPVEVRFERARALALRFRTGVEQILEGDVPFGNWMEDWIDRGIDKALARASLAIVEPDAVREVPFDGLRALGGAEVRRRLVESVRDLLLHGWSTRSPYRG